MNQRAFITLLGGMGAVYGLGSRAQASEGPRRVGLLAGIANEPEGQVRVAAFKQNSARLGWGAKPADLPGQEPAKFELVINKTVAKNLGLDISPVLMAYANEIIE
jgi:putative ABC transport system substrate-binding protein